MLFRIENEETQQRDLSWMLQVRPTQDVQHYFLANINYPFFEFSTWVWPVSAMSMISIRHTLVPRSAEKPHFRWQTTHLRLSHFYSRKGVDPTVTSMSSPFQMVKNGQNMSVKHGIGCSSSPKNSFLKRRLDPSPNLKWQIPLLLGNSN